MTSIDGISPWTRLDSSHNSHIKHIKDHNKHYLSIVVERFNTFFFANSFTSHLIFCDIPDRNLYGLNVMSQRRRVSHNWAHPKLPPSGDKSVKRDVLWHLSNLGAWLNNGEQATDASMGQEKQTGGGASGSLRLKYWRNTAPLTIK